MRQIIGPVGFLDLSEEEARELRQAIGARRSELRGSAAYLQVLLDKLDHRLLHLVDQFDKRRGGRKVCLLCGHRDGLTADSLCADVADCATRLRLRILRLLRSR